jgi:choline-sulfatase
MTKKPNILIVMVDQLTGTLFPDGPAPFLHVPNLRKLADHSVRFGNAYTASPLCAPARASFMSGQLPRRTRVYDNAAEFASDIPTYAHHLRRAGYQTILSGKMHFVGPDQMHGFEQRLTTDIYPADFGWTPDYRKPGERIDWWYHNLGSVTGAGVAEITNQLEYDDDVAHEAVQKIYDLSRGGDARVRRAAALPGGSARGQLTCFARRPCSRRCARRVALRVARAVGRARRGVGGRRRERELEHDRRRQPLHAQRRAAQRRRRERD